MNLSIIIPMFNAEKYIERCLESLMSQNIPHNAYEILIFDDGSTDKSHTLVSTYALQHPNIHLYRSLNKGPYVQRNEGIKRARGRYIYFADADDYLVYGTLCTALDVALGSDLDVLGFKHKITSATDLLHPFEDPGDCKVEVITGADYIGRHRDMRPELWCYLFKLDYLKRMGFTFYTGYYMADYPFTFRAFVNAARAAFCPIDIYRYFMSTDSITREKSKKNLRKIIRSTKKMLTEMNIVIKQAEHTLSGHEEDAIEILKYRRDKHAFWIVLFMIKNNFDPKEAVDYLRFLKTNAIFPMIHYKGKDLKNPFKFKLLYLLFHHKILLTNFIKLRNYLHPKTP